MGVRTTPAAAARFGAWSQGLNRWVERLCAVLLAALVLDVWLGVVTRYFLDLPVTWTETLARYLMIWTALLAVSAGVAHREHVGFMLLFEALPARWQRIVWLLFDVLGFAFFAYLLYFGIGMTLQGRSQYTTIFGMTMVLPYAAVPVSAALACVQLVLAGLRDFTAGDHPEPEVAPT